MKGSRRTGVLCAFAGIVAAAGVAAALAMLMPGPEITKTGAGALVASSVTHLAKVQAPHAEPEEVRPRGGHRKLGRPYLMGGEWHEPAEDPDYDRVGTASWYGDRFQGRLTANGEIFDKGELSAAHPTLPLPSYVRVTNLRNHRSVMVRVNDRGPFKRKRLIDLSEQAAELLGFKHQGTAQVRVEYVAPAPLEGSDRAMLLASYRDGISADRAGIVLASASGIAEPWRFAFLEPVPPSAAMSPEDIEAVFLLRNSYVADQRISDAFQAINNLEKR